MKTYTRIVVMRGDPLTDNEIAAALKVSKQTEWWRALVQLIDASRQDYIERTSGSADRNNPLGLARDVGAQEALTALLIKLAELSGD